MKSRLGQAVTRILYNAGHRIDSPAHVRRAEHAIGRRRPAERRRATDRRRRRRLPGRAALDLHERVGQLLLIHAAQIRHELLALVVDVEIADWSVAGAMGAFLLP